MVSSSKDIELKIKIKSKMNKTSTFELNIFESGHDKNIWKKKSKRTRSKQLQKYIVEINFGFNFLEKRSGKYCFIRLR